MSDHERSPSGLKLNPDAAPLTIPHRALQPRLEGQDPDEVPRYMTEPPGPSWWATVRGGVDIEVRVENGVPWVREGRGSLWRQFDAEEPKQ